MFELLVHLTAISCICAIMVGAWHYRDAFHPLVYLGAMLATLYAGYPWYLDSRGELAYFLGVNDWIFVQGLNLLGSLALLGGAWVGSVAKGSAKPRQSLSAEQRRRARAAAIVVGSVGLASYAYGIISVGGFGAAYGRAYGGGWSQSGWVREMGLLTLPALLFLMMGYQGERPRFKGWSIILLLAMPLLLQGLLGARRGPTFMGLVGLGVGWYLMRERRPSLFTVLASGIALAALMLFLVSNRPSIYLGSQRALDNSPLEYLKGGTGNEYIYGGANMVYKDREGSYFWGRRYLVVFFIRPIPPQVWPSQYEDASEFLGIPNLKRNLGAARQELTYTFGWTGAAGAATGIVADMWIELWWGSLIALFGIGWGFGRTWRRAVSEGGFWVVCFGLLTALSAYLVLQTLEAMSFRFLVTVAGARIIWWHAMRGSRQASGNTLAVPRHSVEVKALIGHPVRPRNIL